MITAADRTGKIVICICHMLNAIIGVTRYKGIGGLYPVGKNVHCSYKRSYVHYFYIDIDEFIEMNRQDRLALLKQWKSQTQRAYYRYKSKQKHNEIQD